MKKVAIVCGAGRGERFGGDKVFADLWGKPLFYWSLKAFEEAQEIDEVIAVVREDAISRVKSICTQHGFKKTKSIVPGGPRRQDSVLRGLHALKGRALVLVHDAARPALTGQLLRRLLDRYQKADVDGVVPVLRPVDTVKETTPDGVVLGTLDRQRLALVQTPQVFLSDKLIDAYAGAEVEFTDDASAVEAAGGRVATVQGHRFNIKVTTKEDLMILECLGRQICQS